MIIKGHFMFVKVATTDVGGFIINREDVEITH